MHLCLDNVHDISHPFLWHHGFEPTGRWNSTDPSWKYDIFIGQQLDIVAVLVEIYACDRKDSYSLAFNYLPDDKNLVQYKRICRRQFS